MEKQRHRRSLTKPLRPVVISAKRFNDIQSRSRHEKKLAQLAAIEEERRYRQYLKEGNDHLCSLFKENILKRKAEAEATIEYQIPEADQQQENESKLLQDHLRRERIVRANKMLEQLKPGPRAVHQALLQSDLIHQRHYNEAVNREIAQAAADQQKLDEQQCPEILIPFTKATEAEVVAQEKAKVQTFRNDLMRDLQKRCRRKYETRLQELCEGAMERVQCQGIINEQEKAAKELRARRHDFGRKAYKEALKEKAERAEHERVCDAIDDRRNCVYLVASRNLSSRYNTHVKQIRADQIAAREARAVRVCQMQQAKKRQADERTHVEEDRYEFEVNVDEERRQCEIKELARQRKAYQLEEQRLAREKRQHEEEIKRFELARRLKNSEANRQFNILEECNQEKIKSDLRKTLYSQRDEFMEQRRLELMRISDCNDDQYLQDDKNFFAQAVDVMEKSREVGRPVYPIAMAAERYRRENNLDLRPESKVVRRSKLRDYCWPGFVSKADMAYRKYEQREKCQEAMEHDRHQIYCNAIKIQKMASVERPYKPCVSTCPIKCFRENNLQPNSKVDFVKCTEEGPPPVPPVDTYPPANVRLSDAKCKMISVVRKVLNGLKIEENPPTPGPPQPHKDKVDVLVPVPISIQVSSNPAPSGEPEEKVTSKKKSKGKSKPAETLKSGFSGGPAPGQDQPADIPDPKGTWGKGPLKALPPPKQPTKRPSGFTGGPLPGQNRTADVPNPKGKWGDGPLRTQPIQAQQPTKRPSGFTGGPLPGQNRPAGIPNPKGTWGDGPLKAQTTKPAQTGPATGQNHSTGIRQAQIIIRTGPLKSLLLQTVQSAKRLSGITVQVPGPNRAADIANQNGNSSKRPVRVQATHYAQPARRPSAFAGGPPAGQNVPAPIPNPKGTWGSGSLQQAATQFEKKR
ncbi:LOW QUALITY PROTEIN: trichohyalin [Drosophila tropicalis]|uniref:LOW QUALITY PROTEIN: trichohyalin n=1 Tax=Drosophila tropicalis TaxID=46794 RepID=UPI0035ABBA37